MDLTDDKTLGRLYLDKDEPSITQEQINERLLYFHSQNVLLDAAKHPMSKYDIEFNYDILEIDDQEFWTHLMVELAKIYSLNNLKMFLSPSFTISEIPNSEKPESINLPVNIKRLFKCLKVDVPDAMNEGKISSITTRQELEELTIKEGYCRLFSWSIYNLDKENYVKFLREILRQKDLDFPD